MKKMKQLILKSKRKSISPDTGFTMVEVLIAILVSSAFVMGALQAMAIDAFFRVKAQQKAQANFWIQEELETVRAEAAALDDESKCNASTAANGYAGLLETTLEAKPELPSKSYKHIPQDSKKKFNLVPEYTSEDSNPDMLKINYKVIDEDNPDESIATQYAEVIPNAAFDCPSK